MPELPEVETVVRGLSPFITGQIVQDIVTNRPDLRIPFPENLKDLQGKTVLNIKRRAKYILISFENSFVLCLHLGMSGTIRLSGNNSESLQKHDHFLMILQNGTKVIFNDPRRFGMVLLLKEEDFSFHPSFKNLGPEPLSPDFSGSYLYASCKGKTSSIKQALLDQRVVSGLGNIYVCEALFKAGIHPKRKAGNIALKRMEKLVEDIRQTLEKAIKAGGSSLKDYAHVDGSLGYFQHQFQVYDQEGRACPGCTCDTLKTGGVQRIVQSGRSTFFCPEKQN